MMIRSEIDPRGFAQKVDQIAEWICETQSYGTARGSERDKDASWSSVLKEDGSVMRMKVVELLSRSLPRAVLYRFSDGAEHTSVDLMSNAGFRGVFQSPPLSKETVMLLRSPS